jgi:hypothetical protein
LIKHISRTKTLTSPHGWFMYPLNIRSGVLNLIGNPVKIGNGPAAVIGDKGRSLPLVWFYMTGKARPAG